MYVIDSPKMMEFWHPSNKLNPSNMMTKSGKRARWICELGHDWTTRIIKIENGRRCPYCAGNKVWTGFNDLATTAPFLAVQWSDINILKANEVILGSTKKVIWNCWLGHEWESSPSVRSRGGGCAVYAGKKVLAGFNDFQSKHPFLSKEWNPNNKLSPDEVMSGTHKKFGWICSEGHDYKASPLNRTHGRGCPYCSGRKVWEGFNDLATLRPELVLEWSSKNTIKPNEVVLTSHKKIVWECLLSGHKWKATIANRTNRNSGCPTCHKSWSWSERHIYRMLKNKGWNIEHQPAKVGRLQPDMVIRHGDLAIVVEFDGVYWHQRKGSSERDCRQTAKFLTEHTHVIRIRNRELKQIPKCIEVSHDFYITKENAKKWEYEILEKVEAQLQLIIQ